MTEVQVSVDNNDYWNYCSKSFGIGNWKKKVPIFGKTATYCFLHAEDATAFKLRFGL